MDVNEEELNALLTLRATIAANLQNYSLRQSPQQRDEISKQFQELLSSMDHFFSPLLQFKIASE
jgi:hypothetical protein